MSGRVANSHYCLTNTLNPSSMVPKWETLSPPPPYWYQSSINISGQYGLFHLLWLCRTPLTCKQTNLQWIYIINICLHLLNQNMYTVRWWFITVHKRHLKVYYYCCTNFGINPGSSKYRVSIEIFAFQNYQSVQQNTPFSFSCILKLEFLETWNVNMLFFKMWYRP